jgi:hypothetical protein
MTRNLTIHMELTQWWNLEDMVWKEYTEGRNIRGIVLKSGGKFESYRDQIEVRNNVIMRNKIK